LDEVPWSLFVDNIVLIDVIRDGIISIIKRWRKALEAQGFRESGWQIGHMECNFSKIRRRNGAIFHI